MSRWVYLSSLKTVEASLVLGAYSPLSLSSPLWSKVFFQNHESVKNEKRPFLKKGTYLLCYLQICKAPKVKSDILLNRGCKQKQIIKFKALDLQGEEELKGALAFLLFYVALQLIPADPHGPVLDTTCGLVPGRLRDCDLLPAEQGPSFFPLKNCTSFIQPLTKLTLASTLWSQGRTGTIWPLTLVGLQCKWSVQSVIGCACENVFVTFSHKATVQH